jgi:hypothetical protein
MKKIIGAFVFAIIIIIICFQIDVFGQKKIVGQNGQQYEQYGYKGKGII